VKRLLIVPAAGRGSRLKSSLPKVLHPVEGRPMIDYLIDLYAARVDRIVLVLHPSFAKDVEDHCAERGTPVDIALQHEPTGMLPAIRLGAEAVARWQPDFVWVSWCDQIAVRPGTLDRMASISEGARKPALTIPTVTKRSPYIHFERDASGRISDVLQRREGVAMPDVGEGDSGIFCLRRDIFEKELVDFSQEVVLGTGTGEANFLPFIPWLAARDRVVTFPVEHESEAIGINTPEDIEAIRGHLCEWC
jgi:bifunctional UDP-N-acetylglucosamine pyrophosphorylase/glucosamine-1-phosphate N-acetyltransferase